MNQEVKGITIEVEEIKIHNCGRKNNADIINKEMKVSSSEEEEIEVCKCRRRS